MTTLNEAMLLLAAHPDSLFIGQGVAYDGVATYRDLEGVPAEKRIEFPVCEEMNVSVALGMSLMGILPIVVIPRFDFLLRAADAIVNHLDKLPIMSCGQFKPKVIIRTRVGSRTPLDAGPQHSQDHTESFRQMLRTVTVHRITTPEQIMPTYRFVLESESSALVVEAL